jgi:hypothetical protein
VFIRGLVELNRFAVFHTPHNAGAPGEKAKMKRVACRNRMTPLRQRMLEDMQSVQVPTCCHSELKPSLLYAITCWYFAPANGLRNVTGTVTDNCVPDPLTDAPTPLIEQYELLAVPEFPGKKPPSHVVPELSAR